MRDEGTRKIRQDDVAYEIAYGMGGTTLPFFPKQAILSALVHY